MWKKRSDLCAANIPFFKHIKKAASHLESAQEQQPKAAGDLLALLRRQRADTLYHGKVQELHRRREEAAASTQLRSLLSALPAGLTHLQLLKDPLTSWLSPVQPCCPSAGATGHTDSVRASS